MEEVVDRGTWVYTMYNLYVIWAMLWIPQTVMGWFWLWGGYTIGLYIYGGHYIGV
jgi:hypothetical protein